VHRVAVSRPMSLAARSFCVTEQKTRVQNLCTEDEILECASHACALQTRSRAAGYTRVKHGSARRKREHGSRTLKGILWCGPLACTESCRRGRLHYKSWAEVVRPSKRAPHLLCELLNSRVIFCFWNHINLGFIYLGQQQYEQALAEGEGFLHPQSILQIQKRTFNLQG